MSAEQRYLNRGQQRVLRVMLHLAGHEVEGLSPSQIAQSLKIAPHNITHDLANLRAAGLAEHIGHPARWQLTPRLSQVGLDMMTTVQRASRKIDEIEQRYTRTPR